jgi:hypothetical protein
MVIEVDEEVLDRVARAASGGRGPVATWEVTPSTHRVENMTTAGLDRISGTMADGTPWSVFVKTLHPASESPVWQMIPPEHHAQVLAELDWLDEPRIYRSGLGAHLPDGVRIPALHHLEETPTRITLWLEDVADVGPWDLERYARAARALGRLAGSWPEERAVTELGMHRRPLDGLFSGKITHRDLPILADDRFWADPEIASVADDRHRADLERLRDVVPSLLQRMHELPHGMAHGDAAPGNLLEPGDGSVVAIDWSYGACGPLGSDLGQLLVGRIESGSMEPSELPDVAAAIREGYLDGLADTGCRFDVREVELAWATHLALRSVFSALILDHRPDLDGDDRRELLARRAGCGRFGLDLVAQVLEGA